MTLLSELIDRLQIVFNERGDMPVLLEVDWANLEVIAYLGPLEQPDGLGGIVNLKDGTEAYLLVAETNMSYDIGEEL